MVIPLYCDSDPRFPHHHFDPVQPENLRDLIAMVHREGADLGAGFDGDGDRLGVVDDQGTIIWGDILMILFWREILPEHPGAVGIAEVKCSQALYDEIARLGGKPMFYRIGHSLIKAKMNELGALFTGEMSSHMVFADEYFGYDDAVYAPARLLRTLSNSDRPLPSLLADAPRYHSTPETRVDCADEVKFEVVRQVSEVFKRNYDVVDVDGARVLIEDGWGLIRASNTQPALVLRAEARTPEAPDRIKRTIEEELYTAASGSTRSPGTRRKWASSWGPTRTPKPRWKAVAATARSFAGMRRPLRCRIANRSAQRSAISGPNSTIGILEMRAWILERRLAAR